MGQITATLLTELLQEAELDGKTVYPNQDMIDEAVDLALGLTEPQEIQIFPDGTISFVSANLLREQYLVKRDGDVLRFVFFGCFPICGQKLDKNAKEDFTWPNKLT
jgi:hypothetical protein